MTRLRAAGIHAAISATIVVALLLLVVKVWYPAPLFELANTRAVFLVLAGCDVILGPTITLIVFNTKKPRSELIRDLSIVALVQIAALTYGTATLLQARPVYIVYSAARFIVVLANETVDADLGASSASANRNPWTGPAWVGLRLPDDREERHRLYSFALQRGVGTFQIPRYFVPYAQVQKDVVGKVRTAERLAKELSVDRSAVDQAAASYNRADRHLGFLPLLIRDNFGIAVVDADSGAMLGIEPLPRSAPRR